MYPTHCVPLYLYLDVSAPSRSISIASFALVIFASSRVIPFAADAAFFSASATAFFVFFSASASFRVSTLESPPPPPPLEARRFSASSSFSNLRIFTRSSFVLF